MRNCLLACTALFVAMPAFAGKWEVDIERSNLTFEAVQSSQSVVGKFPNFTADIDFNEAEPEKGSIYIVVDVTNIVTDSKDAKESLPTKEWLDTGKFSKAEFKSTSISKTGNRQYAAVGKLTIHGITQEVTLPFTLKPDAVKVRADGAITVFRNDYKVGTDQWKSDRWVSYPVRVNYSLLTTPR